MRSLGLCSLAPFREVRESGCLEKLSKTGDGAKGKEKKKEEKRGLGSADRECACLPACLHVRSHDGMATHVRGRVLTHRRARASSAPPRLISLRRRGLVRKVSSSEDVLEGRFSFRYTGTTINKERRVGGDTRWGWPGYVGSSSLARLACLKEEKGGLPAGGGKELLLLGLDLCRRNSGRFDEGE